MILNTTVIFQSLWSFSKYFLHKAEVTINDDLWSSIAPRTMTRSRRKRFIEDPKFDVFLNPTKRKKQDEIVKNLTKKFQKVTGMLMLMVNMMLMQLLMLLNLNIIAVFMKVFKSMDLVQSYPALFQVLWHSINPCFDIRFDQIILEYSQLPVKLLQLSTSIWICLTSDTGPQPIETRSQQSSGASGRLIFFINNLRQQ